MKEFKKFIQRGNVMDLAVGVIMGAAFGKIVSSLVDNIMMPLIGVIIGGIDFSALSFKIGNSVIAYGMFIQSIVDFIVIAFCIFFLVKFMNKLTHKKETKKEPPKQEVLLEEIRDLLKKKK
ncbi:MAG TPA: large-conductance mechanosensitive channel protein MscL [Bacilli bacterium]|nr:large-conductance mechanosensitive channel protein MscL [Bacilli bacterium]